MSKKTTRKQFKVITRNVRIEDYESLKEVMKSAYLSMGGGIWSREHIARLLEIFPEGQICVEVNGRAVACALSLVVDYDHFGDNHTYEQLTGNYTFSTHNPDGDVLYGIDVFVDPNFQGMRLGRRLYDARKELCEKLNLRSIIAGGRIPGYIKHAEELTPKQYIQKVKLRELYDPILTFQISNGFDVKKILKNYLPYDKESKTFATLIIWHNIYFEEKPKEMGAKSVIRVGLVQWQMRNVDSIETMVSHAEFFVDAVSGYNSDFILFPELFNAPLMAVHNDQPEATAIRLLATHTDYIRGEFQRMAVSYNINIITGSMPLYEDEKLFNVAYLCRRDGTWETQKKIHITPNERTYWGMIGGDKLMVFNTDVARIGILICYDVEFPELSRFLSTEDMQVLFVPFLTDTQNGYNRVRYCAQARAIENECYVAIAGSVGTLPRVKNMDIQYAQTAIFSPSDFSFPNQAIVAEATPNAEMTVIADLDLDLLKELHQNGSVRNLKDRRTDLYNLTWKLDEGESFPEDDGRKKKKLKRDSKE